MSVLKKVKIEDRRGGVKRNWFGTRIDGAGFLDGEIVLEDSFTGEAIVVVETYSIVLGVIQRQGFSGKEYHGGLWIDLTNDPTFNLEHWLTMIRAGL